MIYFLVYPLMFTVLRLLLRVLGRLRSRGEQHVPRTGGVLYCPNHLSDCDPTVLFVTVPRRAWYVGKIEIFDIPLLGWFFAHFQGIPIHRDSADRVALRRIETLLKNGEPVVLFPEGRCSEDGKLQTLQPGAARLAMRANVPIIPIGLQHTNGVLPYGTLIPRFSPFPIIVTFGPPISPQKFAHLPRPQAIAALTQTLGNTLARLTDQPPA